MLSCKERRTRISLQKRHAIITFTIEIISCHLADLHIKITIQPQYRDKQLEGRVGVGPNSNIKTT